MIISAHAPRVAFAVVTEGVAPAPKTDGVSNPETRAPEPVISPTAPRPHPLLAPKLTIEFDEAAERFVQTLIDPTNQSVLRRFPAENQLAFSRGVNAYMAALLRA